MESVKEEIIKKQRLVELRKKQAKPMNTQEGISEFLGVTVRAYRGYEKGENLLPLDLCVKLSKLYKVSVDYLLGLDNCEHPNNEYITAYTGLSDKSIEVLHRMNSLSPMRFYGYSVIGENENAENHAFLNIETLNYILEDLYKNWLEKERASHTMRFPETVLYYIYGAIHSGEFLSEQVEESGDIVKLRPDRASKKVSFHNDITDAHWITDASDIAKRVCIDKITEWITKQGEGVSKDGKH